MLPPTLGAWLQHIYRAHLQLHLWTQDTTLHPTIPYPCKLGWNKMKSNLVPTLTAGPTAPEALVELLKVQLQCSSLFNKIMHMQEKLSAMHIEL